MARSTGDGIATATTTAYPAAVPWTPRAAGVEAIATIRLSSGEVVSETNELSVFNTPRHAQLDMPPIPGVVPSRYRPPGLLYRRSLP
jgi:hypothetical protein